jgi:hypothetical protein
MGRNQAAPTVHRPAACSRCQPKLKTMSEIEATLTTTHEFSSFVWKQTSGLKVRIDFSILPILRHTPVCLLQHVTDVSSRLAPFPRV